MHKAGAVAETLDPAMRHWRTVGTSTVVLNSRYSVQGPAEQSVIFK